MSIALGVASLGGGVPDADLLQYLGHEAFVILPDAPLVLLVGAGSAPAEALRDELDRVRRADRTALILVCLPGADVADVERALAAGADDAMGGDVSRRELAGRLRALSRRLAPAPPARRATERLVRVGTLTFDRTGEQLWAGAQRIPLSRLERKLLVMLIGAVGRVVTRDEIRAQLWGPRGRQIAERAVDDVVRRLRRKSGIGGELHTIRGVGYLLRIEKP